MDYQEHNAIRYAAEYVKRHLRFQLEKGPHPIKEDLVLCLVDMREDTEKQENKEDYSADWRQQRWPKGGKTY